MCAAVAQLELEFRNLRVRKSIRIQHHCYATACRSRMAGINLHKLFKGTSRWIFI